MSTCSAYDSKSTTQLFVYQSPYISLVNISDTTVSFTIGSDMYLPDHEDFSYYVLLYGPKGTDFARAIDNGNIGNLIRVNQIPNYLTNSTKPTVSGNYLNPITVSVGIDIFTVAQSYDFAVLAYGYNSSYGLLYENNGWLYSTVSEIASLHIPNVFRGTVTNGDHLLLKDNSWKVTNSITGNTDYVTFDFITNLTDDRLSTIDKLKVKGALGMQPLGYVASDMVLTLPTQGYTDENTDNHYFQLVLNHSYAIKYITGNTYARLFIESIDDLNKQASFKLIYSLVANENRF